MKSLFSQKAYEEIMGRLNNLEESSSPLWGKMNASQMLYHCQLPLNVILEKEDYNLKPNFLIKLFFKKSMYNDKLWRKNMPTMPLFRITDLKDFSVEKKALAELISELYEQRGRDHWQPHPSFGKLTKEQWGKMQYKHLDHHFRQFGI